MRSMGVPDDAFLLALLMGNKSQVFLAAQSYPYNGLITRSRTERECNAYGLAYRPLRVTLPESFHRQFTASSFRTSWTSHSLSSPRLFTGSCRTPTTLVSLKLHFPRIDSI